MQTSSPGCFSAPCPTGLWHTQPVSCQPLLQAATAQVTADSWTLMCLHPPCGCWTKLQIKCAQASPRGGDWWVWVLSQMLMWGSAEAAGCHRNHARGWEVALGMFSVTSGEWVWHRKGGIKVCLCRLLRLVQWWAVSLISDRCCWLL